MNANYNPLKLLVTLLAVSLVALLLSSCGTRKVQKSDTKEETKQEVNVKVENNIKKSTDSFTNVVDNSEVFIIEPIDTIRPLVIGGVIYKNARLTIQKKKVNTTIAKKETVVDLSAKQSAVITTATKQVTTKQIKRKSSNLWFLLWLLVPALGYLGWKYKSIILKFV